MPDVTSMQVAKEFRILFLFSYLTMLLAAPTMEHWMVGRLVNNELERMWKEAVV
jgi:hypothetical protein